MNITFLCQLVKVTLLPPKKADLYCLLACSEDALSLLSGSYSAAPWTCESHGQHLRGGDATKRRDRLRL